MFLNNKRWVASPLIVSILVALYLVILFNRRFWGQAAGYFHYDFGILVAIFFIMASLFIAFNAILSTKYLFKPWLIFLIFISCVASWFTDKFGTIIDRHMLINVTETTFAESSHLITPNFIWYLLLSAFLPSAIILWLHIQYRPFISLICRNLLIIMICLSIACGLFFGISRTLVSTLREHNDLMRVINPIAPLAGAIKYVMQEHIIGKAVFQPIGLDAKIVRLSHDKSRPRIIIMVIGEAARAENFSLQGYNRPTNPQLAKRNIFYFGNVTSCGTSTAQSVPCMFSHLSRHEFDRRKAASLSSLPDILAQAGIKVEWWENNSDSKGVAKRINQVIFYGRNDHQFCLDGECLDGIMLEPLDKWLDEIENDAILFVHQMGSHGPAYFKRYTDKFRQFLPDCRGVEFSRCSDEEIVNAYDNSLLYTDDFLSQIIDKLAARSKKLETALLYMSDHGQSLGENGLYLHGMPYALAPRQQIHIPFVFWSSPELESNLTLNPGCLKNQSMSRSLSHDNLFSSLLGLMEVETSIKQEELDIITPCRHPKEARR